jgi:F-type H+-transporting ATPase subunit gamma
MRDVRRRIRTVRNIQEITKALKMVAAARLQKAESRAKAARPYAEEMVAVMGHLAHATESGDVVHPLLEVRQPVNIGVLVITSDRGMAGSYNTNIIRRTSEIAKRYDKDRLKFITVGKKGRAFFGKQGYDIIANYDMPGSEVTIADARAISRTIRDMFESREIDLVQTVYTQFHSAIRQRVTDQQLLPVVTQRAEEISPARLLGEKTGETAAAEEYIFEPEPAVLLGRLLPRYVDIQVYRAMMESLASEHGARMTSMSTATDNAGEMIERLTLEFNRARQGAITRELIEIVSGAEALK